MQQQSRGFHARRAKAECAKCHPDHAGADFALVRWDSGSPDRFHHADAGYKTSHTMETSCTQASLNQMYIFPVSSS